MITIDLFHFDKQKSGALLKKWIKDMGLTQHHAAEMTSIHPDTLQNCLSGRIQDIKFEIVFKLAVITGHTVDDYIREMLDGEDAAFYCRAVPDAPVDPAATPPVPITEIAMLEAAHEKELTLISQVYERQLERMEKLQDQRIDDLKEEIRALKAELKAK